MCLVLLPNRLGVLLLVEPIIMINGKAGPTERRLHAELLSRGVQGHRFARVPSDYYSLTLEKRASLLCAPSVYHLCVPSTPYES